MSSPPPVDSRSGAASVGRSVVTRLAVRDDPPQTPSVEELLTGIQARSYRVGIAGLGYVGLPLLLEFGKAGFPITGFDIDQAKVDKLDRGETYIRHIPAETIASAYASNPIADATTDFSAVTRCDALLICVPTPLTRHREPDLAYVRNTAETIGPFLRPGQLVVLESTTYPGTTEDVLAPILEEKSGLTAGRDFHVAFSPEREDPNNGRYTTSTIPKVVGGLTDDSLRVARALYDSVITETVPVANCRTAEATKLMENIYRSVNIALVNELKMVFREMDIDVWDVVRAASTKPFGYMPFYPGPGLGGHCIPIDPFYLTWKAREHGVATRFIELAGEINTHMPHYVLEQTMIALNEHSKSLNGSRLLLVGLAYKKNVDDDRESPAYALWKQLAAKGADISYHDPYCPVVRPSREHADLAGIKSVTLEEIEEGDFDAAVIVTNHDCVDHDFIAQHLPLVIDTRSACSSAPNVWPA